MNALSTIITFIQENRKNLTSVFLILGILSATLVVVILLQRSQTYLSEAESSEVVFKNFLKEILPTNEKDLIISESLEVIVELHPKEIPQSYKIGETPLELAQAQLKPYENPPITFTYTFKNLQDNVATLLIEFLYPLSYNQTQPFG